MTPIDILANPEKDTERHRSARCSIARELEVSAAVFGNGCGVEPKVTFRMRVGLKDLRGIPATSFWGCGLRRIEAVVDLIELDRAWVVRGVLGLASGVGLGLVVGRVLGLRWRALDI